MWNRSIIWNANEYYFNVGVLQGSCLGPILWIVLINSLLKRLGVDEGWTVLFFAYDILIIARSPALYRFADFVRHVLGDIQAWAIELSLEFRYEKCLYAVMRPRVKWKPTHSGHLDG